jgi:hypothetical protein
MVSGERAPNSRLGRSPILPARTGPCSVTVNLPAGSKPILLHHGTRRLFAIRRWRRIVDSSHRPPVLATAGLKIAHTDGRFADIAILPSSSLLYLTNPKPHERHHPDQPLYDHPVITEVSGSLLPSTAALSTRATTMMWSPASMNCSAAASIHTSASSRIGHPLASRR